MALSGTELRGFREHRGESQTVFAEWLNVGLTRHYDRSKISKWESEAERIPASVEDFLKRNGLRPPKLAKRVTVAVANQKGGVGKTTIAVNLSAKLANQGFRLLLIDADAQANATIHVQCNPVTAAEAGVTLYDVLRRDQPLPRCVQPVLDGRFDLLAASQHLAKFDAEMAGDGFAAFALRQHLETATGYDFIIIDCSPSLSLMTVNALTAADTVLIPVQTEAFAVTGIPLLLESITNVRRRGNPALNILGIVPTMFDQRNSQDRETLAELHQLYDTRTHLFPPIRRSTDYAKSAKYGFPLTDHDAASDSTIVFDALASALVALALEDKHGAA